MDYAAGQNFRQKASRSRKRALYSQRGFVFAGEARDARPRGAREAIRALVTICRAPMALPSIVEVPAKDDAQLDANRYVARSRAKHLLTIIELDGK